MGGAHSGCMDVLWTGQSAELDDVGNRDFTNSAIRPILLFVHTVIQPPIVNVRFFASS